MQRPFEGRRLRPGHRLGELGLSTQVGSEGVRHPPRPTHRPQRRPASVGRARPGASSQPGRIRSGPARVATLRKRCLAADMTVSHLARAGARATRPSGILRDGPDGSAASTDSRVAPRRGAERPRDAPRGARGLRAGARAPRRRRAFHARLERFFTELRDPLVALYGDDPRFPARGARCWRRSRAPRPSATRSCAAWTTSARSRRTGCSASRRSATSPTPTASPAR